MNWLIYVGGAVATFLLACVLVRGWIAFSQRMAIVDRPTSRSSHTRVTPRGGGVGIVLATLGGLLVPTLFGRTGDDAVVFWIGALAFAIAVVSLVDDIRSLPSLGRLIFQLGVATAAVAVVGAFPSSAVPGWVPVETPPWLMSLLTIAWIVGMTNVYNFMDGVDGIAGAQGVIAGLAWIGYGSQIESPHIIWWGIALAMACAGFLVYNWSPARVFMGDVGSAFLGFVFGVLPLLARRETLDGGAGPAAPHDPVAVFALLIVWPFVADGLFTFARRIKLHQNLLNAHRSHLYQRLTIAGWGHAAVTRLYVIWAGFSALLAGIYLIGGGGLQLVTVALAVVSLGVVRTIVKSVERRAAKGQ